jgi:hypothetical protein
MDKKIIYAQRLTLGVLGALLPLLCIIFGSLNNSYKDWYFTISATYYTAASTIFVGLLFTVGIFLITYFGYEWKDKLINVSAGICSLGIAIFPCGSSHLEFVGMFNLPIHISSIVHSISAVLFFALLGVNILWLFRKGNSNTTEKKIRNKVYLICGILILVFLVLLLVYSIILEKVWGPLGIIFETGILLSFSLAWIVKSETIFKDKPCRSN